MKLYEAIDTNERARCLSSIPNVAGFRFIGITKDDKRIVCYVATNESGSHEARDESDGSNCFHRLAYWEIITS
jgi:hypothetical protein